MNWFKKKARDNISILKIANEYLVDGKYDSILNILNEADPEDFQVQEMYGIVYQQKDNFDLALRYYNKSCMNGINDTNHYNYGNALLITGKWDEAINVSLKAISRYPDHSRAMVTVGLAYYYKKNYNMALKYLHDAEGIEPNYPTVIRKLGEVYLSISDLDMDNPYSDKGIAYFIKAARMGDNEVQKFLSDNGIRW